METSPAQVAAAMKARTPLNLAIESGHGDVARGPRRRGCRRERGWASGTVPCTRRCLSGDKDMVVLLLDAGARVNETIRVQDRSRFSGFSPRSPPGTRRIIERDEYRGAVALTWGERLTRFFRLFRVVDEARATQSVVPGELVAVDQLPQVAEAQRQPREHCRENSVC